MNDINANILQSGSSGNCTILNNIIALDMGVPYKRVSGYVKDLKLVFVGHEHGDHFKGSTIHSLAINRPSLRFCGGEWMASRFIDAGVSKRNIDVIEAGKRYDYGLFQIEPIALVHDVPNLGLKIFIGGKMAVYIVDTATVDGIEAKNFDLALLEANHTKAEIEARIAEKQAAGEFAYELRAERNHLSQEQAIEWLVQNAGANSRYVFMHQHKERKINAE